jgi:hypothetical protein
MQVVVSSKTLPNAAVITAAIDDNPGKKITGPTWAKTAQFDDLPWIGNRKLGDVPDEELRPVLHRLGIEGAHRDGRTVLAARYGALLGKIHDDAGRAAVDTFLSHRS